MTVYLVMETDGSNSGYEYVRRIFSSLRKAEHCIGDLEIKFPLLEFYVETWVVE
jgi:hypothetical protein